MVINKSIHYDDVNAHYMRTQGYKVCNAAYGVLSIGDNV